MIFFFILSLYFHLTETCHTIHTIDAMLFITLLMKYNNGQRIIQERGILQELELRKDVRKDAGDSKGTPGRMVPLPAEREPAKTLDVFWFLKPCTLAS